MKRLLYCCFVLSLLLSGCATAQASQNTSGSSLTPTLTSEIINTSATTATPVPTETPTPTPTPSTTPTSTSVPTETPSPTPTKPTCINRAEFVRHLSVSDNTKLLPNVFFAKVWRIKNTGTCTWTPSYSIVFSSGEDFGSQHETSINREVKPGETIDVQVALRTPLEPKTYTGQWMIKDQFGNLFGTGETGDQPLTTQVVVIPFSINERLETFACG